MWDGDECNEIRGTESSIFPPFTAKEDGLWVFEGNICRSMKVLYERPSKYRGIPTLHYHLDLGDIAVIKLPILKHLMKGGAIMILYVTVLCHLQGVVP